MLAHKADKCLNVFKIVKHELGNFGAKIIYSVNIRISLHCGRFIVRQEGFFDILFCVLKVEDKRALLIRCSSIQSGKSLNSRNVFEFLIHIHCVEQGLIKAGLIFVCNNKNVIQIRVERLAELLISSNVLTVLIKVHCCFGVRFLRRHILKRNLSGERNHYITALGFFRMILQILFDCKVIANCICTAVGNNHGFSFTADLITAIFKEVRHNHFGLLRNGVAVLLVIFE